MPEERIRDDLADRDGAPGMSSTQPPAAPGAMRPGERGLHR
ncbi:hypothetical protein [Streptomyces sp. NPDC093149]